MMIRECRAEDPDALEARMPTRGTRAHEWLFGRQEAGTATYLVAWPDGSPAGVGLVNWAGFREAEAREGLPGCPELSNLHVAEDARGRGVGTALIRAAEDLARTRGYRRLGLGVDEDNPDAARLYLRLGYVDSGVRCVSRYTYPDDAGVPREMVEHCRCLVIDL